MTKKSSETAQGRTIRALVAILAASALIGCGGSNGSGQSPTATTTLANTPTATTAPATPTATATAATAPPTATPTATSPPGAPTPTPTTPIAGPGVQGSITNVAINASGTVVVTFTLTDGQGVPLTAVTSSTTDPQLARVRFTIAHIEDYSGGGEFNQQFSRYVNDINMTNPGLDSNGVLQTLDAAAGVYQYTFGKQLTGFDPSLTYTVGEQVDRTFNGQRIGVNPVFSFVPNGGTPEVREDVTLDQCNNCHNPLIAHGNRRNTHFCVLCHAEAAVDANGTTIQFRNMIHKIHDGKDLPSIVNGAPGANYAIGRTVFAEKQADGTITGVGFPKPIESCLTCHSEGATATYYKERPAAAACASCHDDVNPSLQDTAAGPPGTNHFQNKGFADGDCGFCHVDQTGDEFDISIVGAHVVPEQSMQLAGLNLALVDVTNHAAGEIPTISFKVTDNAGTPLTDLSGLNRLGFTITGPTTDYAQIPFTPTAVGGGASGTLTGPDADGVFQYTVPMSATIPANATGTWTVGAEARRSVTLQTVSPIAPKTVNEAAVNPIMDFSVDGSTVMARRTVVDVDAKCANCHGQFSKGFSIHGNLRNQTHYCVLCHNPNNSDVSQRKTDPAQVEAGARVTSIDFKMMIHKIHRGENLEQKPYIIYGFGGSVNVFSDVLFPGDLRDCQTCHVDTTYLIPPFPGTALGTQVAHLNPADGSLVVDGRIGPIQAVCTACHDSDDAVAHAQAQTSDGVESCPVCHEEGRDFAVSLLHAGRN
jgi:OmcA/MtrC family decaheme c-type cytochrome